MCLSKKSMVNLL